MKSISWPALTGMSMPIGILLQVSFGQPSVLVINGGTLTVAMLVRFGLSVLKPNPVQYN